MRTLLGDRRSADRTMVERYSLVKLLHLRHAGQFGSACAKSCGCGWHELNEAGGTTASHVFPASAQGSAIFTAPINDSLRCLEGSASLEGHASHHPVGVWSEQHVTHRATEPRKIFTSRRARLAQHEKKKTTTHISNTVSTEHTGNADNTENTENTRV